MSADPLVLLDDVERATSRLLATAGSLDADPSAPSLLPGWTRGHVLTHVARNADSLVNLLTWARTGVVTPQPQPAPAQRSTATKPARHHRKHKHRPSRPPRISAGFTG